MIRCIEVFGSICGIILFFKICFVNVYLRDYFDKCFFGILRFFELFNLGMMLFSIYLKCVQGWYKLREEKLWVLFQNLLMVVNIVICYLLLIVM